MQRFASRLRRAIGGALFPLLLVVVLPACQDPVAPVAGEHQVLIKPVNVQGQYPGVATRVRVNGQAVPYAGLEGHSYAVNLRPGTYPLVVESPGYDTHTATLRVREEDPERFDHFATLTGPVAVNGRIVNSQTGTGLEGALIRFYRQLGEGNYDGNDFQMEVTTDVNGNFHLDDTPSGFFTVLVQKEGFVQALLRDVELTSGVLALDPVALVPPPPAGTFRVVLTWGEGPADLDAHLTGPDGAGGRYHVFWANPSVPGATLDLDDTSSFGPETITFDVTTDGLYRFSVHNWTNQGGGGAWDMWATSAYVELYGSTGRIGGWNASQMPEPHMDEGGNTWRVFELTVNGGAIAVNAGAGYGIGWFTAAGAGDMTVFLHGGGGGPATKAVN